MYFLLLGRDLTVDLSNNIESLLERLQHGGYLKEHISFGKLSTDVVSRALLLRVTAMLRAS